MPAFWAGGRAVARGLWISWRDAKRPAPAPRWGVLAAWGAACLLALPSALIWLDIPAVQWARGLSPGWIRAAEWITRIGASGYIFALSALCAIWAAWMSGRQAETASAYRRLAERALLAFAVAATSGIASLVLKHAVGRARPRLSDQLGAFHFDPLSMKSVLASFPSGHTITAFAMAHVIGLFLPAWRIPLIALACLVGLSRVMLGAHYPGDVVAGAAIGLLASWLTCRAFAARRIAVEFTADGGLAAHARGEILRALRPRV